MTLIDKILGKSTPKPEHEVCGDCKNFVNRHGDTGLCILRPMWVRNCMIGRPEYPKMYRDEDCSGFTRGNATLEVGVNKCETCAHFTPRLRYGGLCALATGYQIDLAHAADDLCGKYRRKE